MKAPIIFESLDIKQFLKQVYEFRKSTEKGFSYQSWAEEMGIKDRSYLHQVVVGKRSMNQEMIANFQANLKMNEVGREYFAILKEYSNAKNETLRDELGKKLVNLIKQSENPEQKPKEHL